MRAELVGVSLLCGELLAGSAVFVVLSLCERVKAAEPPFDRVREFEFALLWLEGLFEPTRPSPPDLLAFGGERLLRAAAELGGVIG